MHPHLLQMIRPYIRGVVDRTSEKSVTSLRMANSRRGDDLRAQCGLPDADDVSHLNLTAG